MTPPQKKSTSMNVHEAKTHFSRLLARVEKGEAIIISRAGRPVAKLVPFDPAEDRVGGRDKGLVEISPDFDEPLTEDDFGGEPE